MRFELSLFGIIVATVMADAVGSRFHDNDAGVALPPTSRYELIEEIIRG